MLKRVLSVILALSLLAQTCPLTVLAEEVVEPTVLETTAPTEETTIPTEEPTVPETEETLPETTAATEPTVSETTEEPTQEPPAETTAPEEEEETWFEEGEDEIYCEEEEDSEIAAEEDPAMAAAENSGKCGENLTWSLSDDGTLTITGTGPMEDYYSASPWAAYAEQITKLDLHYGITSVGNYAFYRLTKLTSVVIPDSVTRLGSSSFGWCTGLTSITLPDSVTSIGGYCFSNTGLTSITIPEGVAVLEAYTFAWCHDLTSVTLPEGLTTLKERCFLCCTSLRSAKLPSTVTSLGDLCFSECQSLTNVTIPSSLTSLGDLCFSSCTSLVSVVIPDTVTKIGGGCFSSCKSLTSVTLPKNITSVPDYCFQNCESLTGITIPKGVASLGTHCFDGCKSLSNVTIPSAVTSIGSYCFASCASLTSIAIPRGITSLDRCCFISCTNLKTVTIPDSVISLGDSCFESCESLTGIVLPVSVASLGTHCFDGCKSLTEITIPQGVSQLGAYFFRGCEKLTSVTIPDSVTALGYGCFFKCTSLTQITIPDSVTTLGGECFKDCTLLETVVLPKSLAALPEHCFENCTSLKQILLPDTLTSLGSYCFRKSGLTQIQFPAAAASVGEYCFNDCAALTRVTVSPTQARAVSVGSLGRNAFYNCAALTEVALPDGITALGDYSFFNCKSLESFALPGKLTSLGKYAFQNCAKLKGITIPDGVTELPQSCFQYCTALEEVVLPARLTSIGDYSFYQCSGLKEIRIPNGVTTLGNYSFAYCAALADITLSNSITAIGNSAFYSCKALETIALPRYLTTLGSSCFGSCQNLTSIGIPAKVTELGSSCFSGCRNMEKIFFRGDPPVIGSNAFGSVKAMAFYPSRNTNWTDAQKQNYGGTLTWMGDDTFVPNLKSDEYEIVVRDIYGEPVAGAVVTFNKQEAATDEYGSVKFQRSTLGQPRITVTHAEYIQYTNEGQDYEKEDTGYEVIVLYRIGESSYKLQSAEFADAFLSAAGARRDVLCQTKELSSSNSSGVFDLYVKAMADPSLIASYQLWEESKLMAQCDSSGCFLNLKVKDFTPEKKLSVRVIATDGTTTDNLLALSVVRDVSAEATGLEFGEKISFTVDSDVPLFGGHKLGLEMPDLPVSLNVTSDNVLRLGINIKSFDTEGEKTMDEQWEDMKEDIRSLVEISRETDLSSVTRARIQEIAEGQRDMLLLKEPKASANIIGYLEGKLNPDGTGHLKGYLCVSLNASYTFYGPPIVVWVIPIGYSVTVGVNASATGEGQVQLGAQTYSGDLKLELKPYVNAFGGIMIGNLIGAGIYGSAEMPIEIQMIGTSDSHGVNSIDLTGEVGVKAYIGPYEESHPAHYGTWHLYDRNKSQAVTASAETYMSRVYDQNSYEVARVDYLEATSGWMGASAAKANALTMSVLQENIYRNSQPVLGNSKGTPVLVWAAGNAQRSAMNASQLMYSVFRFGSWSAPAPVDPAGVTGENSPALASAPDGTLYLTYQRSRTILGDNASMADYAAAQEIVAARFDSVSGSFKDVTVLSGSEGYHRNPSIYADQNTVTVLWTANSNTADLFGMNSTNSICYAQRTSSGWGKAATLAQNLNQVTFAKVGSVNGQLMAAVITDGDNNLSTADHTLTAYPNLGAGRTVAAGNVSQVEFAQLPGQTASSLIWATETGLSHWNGSAVSSVAEASIRNGYRVLADRIVYAAAGQGGAELYALVYDGTGWSTPIAVTQQGKYLQYYDVKTIGSSTYVVATQVDATITETDVEDLCTLAWTKLASFTDLKLAAVFADDSDASSGKAYTLTADVANLGDTAVSSFTVTVSQNGKTVATQTVSETLTPGVMKAVALPMPALAQSGSFTVSVSATGDVTADNNSRTLTIGSADLKVDAQLYHFGESKITAMVTVENAHTIPAGGTLYITCDGEQIQTLSVPQLAAGESSIFELALDKTFLNGKSEGMLEFRVESTGAERNTTNNSAYLNVKIGHLHDFAAVVTKPTCTREGYTTYSCKCGESYVDDETALLPHTWNNGTVTKEPTEQEEGIRRHTCTACGETKDEPIDKLVHVHSYTDVVTAPTCTEKGYTTHTCTCGESYVDAYTDPAPHTFGEWETVLAPTEETGGERRRSCTLCGHGESQEIPPQKFELQVELDPVSGKPRVFWQKIGGVAKYRIYRATSKTGSFKFLKTAITADSYTDTSAKGGSYYYYKVRIYYTDENKAAKWSDVVSLRCALAAPKVSMSVSTATGKPVVKWKTVSGAAKYRVYRAEAEDGEYTLVYTGKSARSYTDKTAETGVTYYYKVRAIHSSKESANSNFSEVISRTCDLAKPVVSIKLSKNKPRLSWKAIDGAVEYRIYRSRSKSGTYELLDTVVDATSYRDESAKAGRTWYYKVRAVHGNEAANSAYSSVKYIKAK